MNFCLLSLSTFVPLACSTSSPPRNTGRHSIRFGIKWFILTDINLLCALNLQLNNTSWLLRLLSIERRWRLNLPSGGICFVHHISTFVDSTLTLLDILCSINCTRLLQEHVNRFVICQVHRNWFDEGTRSRRKFAIRDIQDTPRLITFIRHRIITCDLINLNHWSIFLVCFQVVGSTLNVILERISNFMTLNWYTSYLCIIINVLCINNLFLNLILTVCTHNLSWIWPSEKPFISEFSTTLQLEIELLRDFLLTHVLLRHIILKLLTILVHGQPSSGRYISHMLIVFLLQLQLLLALCCNFARILTASARSLDALVVQVVGTSWLLDTFKITFALPRARLMAHLLL